MKKIACCFYLLVWVGILTAQDSATRQVPVAQGTNADDPANFLTRVEVFNELQHYDNGVYLNQSVLRSIVQLGKRFSTRIDAPYVYNSFNSASKYQHSGIGDISIRLLGYKIKDNPKAAITASLEASLNTAQSPLLGTGKHLLIPMVSYTRVIPKRKMLYSMVFQQTNAVSGDKTRENVSFSKLQLITLKYFSRKTWLVLATDWYIDYVHGGVSMNLRSRLNHAPIPRINIWVSPGAGIFGDFKGRYQWSVEIGSRFFMFRKMHIKERGKSL